MNDTAKLSERISGIAVSTRVYRVVHEFSERLEQTPARIMRGFAAIGVAVNSDPELRSKIRDTVRLRRWMDMDTAIPPDLREGEEDQEAQRVIQESTRIGLDTVRPSPPADLRRRKQGAAKSKRIAGLSMREEDHAEIQRMSSSLEISEAQSFRECFSIGEAVYADERLRQEVESVVLRYELPERDVICRALKGGIDECARRYRADPVREVRDLLGGSDPSLDHALSEYLYRTAVSQPSTREEPEWNVHRFLRGDPYDEVEVESIEADADRRLRILKRRVREDPMDDADRELARYFENREAEFRNREAEEAAYRQERLSGLLEVNQGEDK